MNKLLLSSVLLAAPLAAQAGSGVAPDSEVLRAFSLRAGSVQDLVLPRAGMRPFAVDLVLRGRKHRIELTPHDLRSSDFQVWLDDGVGLKPGARAPSTTFQGRVTGLRTARVAASLVDGQLWAMIHTTGGVFAVQPVREHLPKYPRTAHVVYEQRHVTKSDTRCDVVRVPAQQPDPATGHAGNALVEAEIAVDCDNAYYNRKGKSTTRVQADVMRVLNAVDVIYQRDVGVKYKVTAIIIRTSKVYTGTSTGALLGQMRTRWNNNHKSIRRDLAHMFTGVGSFSGVVGTAYVGVVCGSWAYGVSKAFSGTLTRNAGLVSHECGHNWNAGHCNGSSPCYIMCSSLGGCGGRLGAFGTKAKGQITRHRNSRRCLKSLSPGTWSSYGRGCPGTGNKTPLLSTSGLPTVNKSFPVRVSNARPNKPVTFWFGVSDTVWGALTLPFDLQQIGASGCQIYASAEFLLPSTSNATGIADLSLKLPNDTSLVGVVFFHQAFVADSGANAAGLAVTRAGVGKIGY